MLKPRTQCPHCTKPKLYATADGLWHHVANKHPGKEGAKPKPVKNMRGVRPPLPKVGMTRGEKKRAMRQLTRELIAAERAMRKFCYDHGMRRKEVDHIIGTSPNLRLAVQKLTAVCEERGRKAA